MSRYMNKTLILEGSKVFRYSVVYCLLDSLKDNVQLRIQKNARVCKKQTTVVKPTLAPLLFSDLKRHNLKQLPNKLLSPHLSKKRSPKIISGGQTGADRAGLEAAFDLGLSTGGWAPRNFLTAQGKDPVLGTKFHLVEITCPPNTSVAQMYVLRSRRNVDDSDGTLAFRLQPSVGTDKTIGYCITRKWAHPQKQLEQTTNYKPCLVISDLTPENRQTQISTIVSFIRDNNIQILNIAGHRDDVVPDFQLLVKELIYEALSVLVKE